MFVCYNKTYLREKCYEMGIDKKCQKEFQKNIKVL